MPVAIKYFKCIFPNGKRKTYRNINTAKFAKLVSEDKNNVCCNCNYRPVLREKEVLNHIGRYDVHYEEINGHNFRILNVKDRWCRGCQITETSKANLDIARQHVDYDAAAKRLNERTSEEGYIRACRRMYHEMLTRHKNRPDKIMKFYYADINESNEVCKIGICTEEKHRIRINQNATNYTYKNLKVLAVDNYRIMAKLEYDAKVKFGIRGFDLGVEFIHKKDIRKLLKFVKNYKYSEEL